MFGPAILIDARLMRESLQVEEPALKDLPVGETFSISATSNASNEAQLRQDPNGDLVLLVDTEFKVTVKEQKSDVTLASYLSRHRCGFKVVGKDVDDSRLHFTPEGLSPYTAQANWVAARRADATLAATGIANLRLNVPPPITSEPVVQESKESSAKSPAAKRKASSRNR
jgi:hypothetical protein